MIDGVKFMAFDLPIEVEMRARSMGQAGVEWLNGLEDILSRLEDKWNIRRGKILSGGSHACVCEVFGPEGEKFILKVDLPDVPEGEYAREVETLRIADGHGYVRLYACDIRKRAMLLERLGHPLKASGLPPEEQMRVICETLSESWEIPVPEGKLAEGSESLKWFREYLRPAWRSLGKPCPETIVNRAYECIESRERNLDPSGFVLVHGDAHNNNTLLSTDGSGRYKLIDPDGMLCEKACDLGVLMREWPEMYKDDPVKAGRERCAYLSALTGADARGIWEWGYIQTVSTALVLFETGREELAREMLDIARAWSSESVQ